MNSVDVAACFRVARCGGPDEESVRGLTLELKTVHIDRTFRTLADIDLLIKSQQALVDRAMRIYGVDAVGYAQEQNTLTALKKLQTEVVGLSPMDVAIRVFSLLVNIQNI